MYLLIINNIISYFHHFIQNVALPLETTPISQCFQLPLSAPPRILTVSLPSDNQRHILNKSDTKIISLCISEFGKQSGVIFIQTNTGSLVLKANNQAPEDLFYNQLAFKLELDVPVLRTLGCYSQEFKNLLYLIQQYCHTDEVLFHRLKTKLDYPFHQLLQYIPCIHFPSVSLQRYQKHQKQQYKMVSIGMCLAFDLVINNGDRFSLLWRGQGNINNILIQVQMKEKMDVQAAADRNNLQVKIGDYWYIDHSGNMLDVNSKDAKNNIQKYMEKVTEFQLNVVQFLRREHTEMAPQFQKLMKQIKFFTNYQLSEQDLIKISQGIIYSTKKYIDSYESKAIKQLYQSIFLPIDTKSKQQNYWNLYWNDQFKKRVHLQFIQLMYIKVSAIYSTYPQLINEIMQRVGRILRKRGRRSQNNDRRSTRKDTKGSKYGSQLGKEGEDQVNQQSSQGNDQNNKGNQEDQAQSEAKRRWREKLELFKAQNYK